MGGNIRRDNYPLRVLELVQPSTDEKETYMKFKGITVKMNSLRYDTFKVSTVCHVCGIKGAYLGLDSGQGCNQKKRGHFNLYAVKDGKEILMTKGSKLDPRGYMTTCAVCAKVLDKELWRPKGGVVNGGQVEACAGVEA